MGNKEIIIIISLPILVIMLFLSICLLIKTNTSYYDEEKLTYSMYTMIAMTMTIVIGIVSLMLYSL